MGLDLKSCAIRLASLQRQHHASGHERFSENEGLRTVANRSDSCIETSRAAAIGWNKDVQRSRCGVEVGQKSDGEADELQRLLRLALDASDHPILRFTYFVGIWIARNNL